MTHDAGGSSSLSPQPPETGRSHIHQPGVRPPYVGHPRSGPRRHRIVTLGAAGAVVALGVAAVQIVSPGGGGSVAQAAVALDRATVEAASALTPRPDQFVLVRIRQVENGATVRVNVWASADGSRPGRVSIDSGPAKGSTDLPAYDPAKGLQDAPYRVVAALPTDPRRLLEQLERDPMIAIERDHNKISKPVAVWGLIRNLVVAAPPAQQAALLRAAKLVPGVTLVKDTGDAMGRPGEAVALTDPRLGEVQLVFDRRTNAFLGERILGSDYLYAVDEVAVVDAPGRPRG